MPARLETDKNRPRIPLQWDCRCAPTPSIFSKPSTPKPTCSSRPQQALSPRASTRAHARPAKSVRASKAYRELSGGGGGRSSGESIPLTEGRLVGGTVWDGGLIFARRVMDEVAVLV